jgi:leucine efflux protein
VLVLLAHRLAARIQAQPWMARVLNKIAGSLLIAFGLKLALSK